MYVAILRMMNEKCRNKNKKCAANEDVACNVPTVIEWSRDEPTDRGRMQYTPTIARHNQYERQNLRPNSWSVYASG
jgi:hypothetical protein